MAGTGAVAAIGECMVELIDQGPGEGDGLGQGWMRRGFGGDTLNTSVYLARLGVPVAYVTQLGDDVYSDEMTRAWQEEGMDTSLTARKPGAQPGLYAIHTDANGERSFAYWRWNAPVRTMVSDGVLDRLRAELDRFAALYLSGITLSLFDDAQRQELFRLCEAARERGLTVAFDTNHRPRCWPSAAAASDAYDRMAAIADTMMPSWEDCQAVYADSTPEDAAVRFARRGAETVVIKQGERGAGLYTHGHWREVPGVQVAQPVDTSAAGDSFNAGFLAARRAGASVDAAAVAGNRLAAVVIGHKGTIIPRATFQAPDLSDLTPASSSNSPSHNDTDHLS
ncbi:sugar kinase [Rhodovibrio salinarum]|uniref:Sugar kinase n=1 Tax=Rhodovibrio salinarum TaxID=1087 RepID=A0A934V140_9PROT|nr:sugar kinase [Rhodovibrio salinarum]MBK1698321.1 sugar kinase [Rhodovibrio salinarum]